MLRWRNWGLKYVGVQDRALKLCPASNPLTTTGCGGASYSYFSRPHASELVCSFDFSLLISFSFFPFFLSFFLLLFFLSLGLLAYSVVVFAYFNTSSGVEHQSLFILLHKLHELKRHIILKYICLFHSSHSLGHNSGACWVDTSVLGHSTQALMLHIA